MASNVSSPRRETNSVDLNAGHSDEEEDAVSIASQCSRTSSSGSKASDRNQKLIKLASMKTRKELLAKQVELELRNKQMMLELEHKNKLMQQQVQLESEEAVIRDELIAEEIIDRIEEQGQVPTVEDVINIQRPGNGFVEQLAVNSALNPARQPFEPRTTVMQDSDSEVVFNIKPQSNNKSSVSVIGSDTTLQASASISMVKAIELMSKAQLPKLEFSVFSGDTLAFPQWLASFEQLIETVTDSPIERVHYLHQYTANDAKLLVSGFLLDNTESSYQLAKQELIREYGNAAKIARSYLDKVDTFKPISSNDSSSLRSLNILLKSCRSTMPSVRGLNQLNTDLYLVKIVSKLPIHLQASWRRHATKLMNTNHDVNFDELVKFIDEETCIATNPVFGAEALRSALNSATTKPAQQQPRRFINAATNAQQLAATAERNQQPATSAAATQRRAYRTVGCMYCDQDHDIEACRDYLNLTLEERKKFLISKKLCYGCLRLASSSHRVKTCKRKRKCVTCNRRHPTSLHDVRFDKKTGNSSAETELKATACNTKISASSVHKPVVLNAALVRLSYGDKSVLTYAAVDTLSSASFIDKQTWQQLGTPGEAAEIAIKTIQSEEKHRTTVVSESEISSYDGTSRMKLPKLFVHDHLPIDRADIVSHEILKKYPHLQPLITEIPEADESVTVGLLLGVDCIASLKPIDYVSAGDDSPVAVKTSLGWTVFGPVDTAVADRNINFAVCSFTNVQRIAVQRDDQATEMLQRMFETDFIESTIKLQKNPALSDEKLVSYNDISSIKQMSSEVQLMDGHYQLPLLFRSSASILPNNRFLALKRLQSLKHKLQRDLKYKDHYVKFVNNMLDKGYAKKSRSIDGLWYIPHHGVYHQFKPDKIRVVFDCSAQYQGVSLNKVLMSGPDMTNTLVGVLLRFRQERIAIMGDIESMFCQVRVPEAQQNYLRFLWWPNGDLNAEPEDYQMCVHLFGAVSSPSCANFALRKAAEDNIALFGQAAADTLQRNFYVDDMLKSVSDAETATELIPAVRSMCAAGGFNLTSFLSNSETVLESLPESVKSNKSTTNMNLGSYSSVERALGVQWCIENDELSFRILLKDKPLTRRGILSTISSIYDPLGLASPFLLKGKLILQSLCKKNLKWDDEIDEVTGIEWQTWRATLPLLERIKVQRCFKPEGFGEVQSASLHHFSDASQYAYGQCSYLRLQNPQRKVHCSLIVGKSRVAPNKPITIPRLELVAATVSVKMNQMLQRELQYKDLHSYFYTDSAAVLGYINNDAKRFHVFVANRVQLIKENSDLRSWNYIKTKLNPADEPSRGVSCDKIVDCQRWFRGPDFLWRSDIKQLNEDTASTFTVQSSDPEIIKKHLVKCCATRAELPGCGIIVRWSEHFSSWYKLKKYFTWIYLVVLQLRNIVQKGPLRNLKLKPSVYEMRQAEVALLRYVQAEYYIAELTALKAGKSVKESSSLSRLSPVVNNNNLLCVGGRLRHSEVDEETKHPIIMPKQSHISKLIIKYYHQKSAHSGKEFVVAASREKYWIIGAQQIAKTVRQQCFTCRKLYSKPIDQYMADLPTDRVQQNLPPFTNVGVDYFGPFMVKVGRCELKRYGCIFTCMNIRAVHIEPVYSMETDSFLNALQRFIARRGKPKLIRSDNGTNFIGAERELRAVIKEWNNSKTEEFLRQDDIEWKFNPPTASHMGGVWERQIRTVRKIMSALTNQQRLTDEVLHTVFCVTENIINSRPISAVSDDPEDLTALTPNHLLQLRSGPSLPPGNFVKQDQFSRRRWRQVQYIANLFWNRWKSEYLPLLQSRSKWHLRKENLKVGDIVLQVEENLPRYQWALGRVVEVVPSEDNLVRTVKIKTRSGLFTRPIHKLCLLESSLDEI